MSYYISVYGQYMLAAVIVALLLAVVVRMTRLGIHMQDVMGVKFHLFQRKKRAYLLTAIYLVACVAVFSLGLSYQCSAALSFNYDGASHGLNPNQTRFNQADILGTPVLERMVENKILSNVTAAELAEVLHISSEDRPSSQQETDDENYRVSAEYQVEYVADSNTCHLNGENVLQVFAQAYYEWFAQQNATNLSPLDMDFASINEEDYLDICDHLDTEARRVINFMSIMGEKGPSFQSQETGEGFQSIQTRADSITNTLVADLRAYVLEHGLSKNTQSYLGRLSTENILLDFDARKEGVSNENWLSVIRRYEDDMARIVLVPTYDTKGQFYMSQTKIGVDEFAEQAEGYADQMVNLHSLIADNEYLFRQLSATQSEKTAAERAERMIEQIEEELSLTAQRAKMLIQEFEAKQANGYMTVTVEPWESRTMSVLKKSGALTIIFFLLIHASCFLSEVRKARKGKQRTTQQSPQRANV